MVRDAAIGAAPAASRDSGWSLPALAGWRGLAAGATWFGFAVAVLLGALAPVARTGDAHQYYAMAFNLAAGEPPALTTAQVANFKTWLAAQPPASEFAGGARAVDQLPLIVAGRQEFSHFWLYPLLAAPGVILAEQIGLAPGYAFLAVNATLLGIALWQVQRTYSAVAALFLLATPIVWFINKAQVEVFTFALLSLALAQAGRGRWLWASLAAAIAATQNAPILAATVCFWGAGLLVASRTRPGLRPTLGGAALVIGTAVIGLAHPVYYWWRLGVLTPQQLNGGIAFRPPAMEQVLAVLADPDLGLLAWLPLHAALAALGAGLIWWWPRRAWFDPLRPLVPDIWTARRLSGLCSLMIGIWFLVVFAQTTNVNSGGTVHVSRYALWLVPLGLPMIATAAAWLGGYLPGLLPIIGGFALVIYVTLFRPAQPEQYVVQSPQAAALTALTPELYRPVPEIFYERLRHRDGGVRGSAALPSCRLILLHAADRDQPCPLTGAETTRAEVLLAADWQAVWISRPGMFQLAGNDVRGAVPRP